MQFMKLKNVLSLQPESEKAEQSAFIQNKKIIPQGSSKFLKITVHKFVQGFYIICDQQCLGQNRKLESGKLLFRFCGIATTYPLGWSDTVIFANLENGHIAIDKVYFQKFPASSQVR